MQETYQKDPSNIFAYIAMYVLLPRAFVSLFLTPAPRFYQYYCTNGQTYLKKDLDNSKYPEITPVTFKGFLKAQNMEGLADAYQNAGSAV